VNILMDEEEKRLQIKLAQLQADIQIWLSYCFGSLAAMASLAIASWTLYSTTSQKSFLATLVISYIGMVVLVGISASRMKVKRREMDTLK
jgi:hypothetical protein